jgi:phosphate-selective porin OprO/OprP
MIRTPNTVFHGRGSAGWLVACDNNGGIMSRKKTTMAAAIGLAGVLTPQAQAQSAGGQDAEIALLRQQLRLMEQKLDRLEKQTNAPATAKGNAKADDRGDAETPPKVVDTASANAAYPIKQPVAPSDGVVRMPNNRPNICTAGGQNCIAIASRIHFDAGGYNYHPNSHATNPQKLDDGTNLRRARLGLIAKQISAINPGDAGSRFDALAMRTQVAF